MHFIHVLDIDTFGLDMDIALRLPGISNVGTRTGSREAPPPPQRGVHDGRRERAGVMRVQVLFRQVVHDFCGFGGGQQADGGSVAEEAQVAVVSDDVHGGIPGDLRGRRCAGPDVVDGADVAAVEAEARAGAEHLPPGGGVGALEEGERCRVGG